MLQVQGLSVEVGGRLIVADASFTVMARDKVGLVGRNGAGKTTLMRALAGESQPGAGAITKRGDVGYLPQDPRTGDLDVLSHRHSLPTRTLRCRRASRRLIRPRAVVLPWRRVRRRRRDWIACGKRVRECIVQPLVQPLF